MDNKQFVNILAERCNYTPEQCAGMVAQLTSIMRQRCSEMNTIAIPAFGSFTPIKTDEYIAKDANGQTTLYPPQISIEFIPGALLKKHIRHEK